MLRAVTAVTLLYFVSACSSAPSSGYCRECEILRSHHENGTPLPPPQMISFPTQVYTPTRTTTRANGVRSNGSSASGGIWEVPKN